MNNLVMGKSSRVREVKIRNLTRILMSLEEDTSDIEFNSEDEKQSYIRELRSDIEELKNEQFNSIN